MPKHSSRTGSGAVEETGSGGSVSPTFPDSCVPDREQESEGKQGARGDDDEGTGDCGKEDLSGHPILHEVSSAGSGAFSPEALTVPTTAARKASLSDFELLKVIGMGAFGKVLQVRDHVRDGLDCCHRLRIQGIS